MGFRLSLGRFFGRTVEGKMSVRPETKVKVGRKNVMNREMCGGETKEGR
jgi:hypothetical protein